MQYRDFRGLSLVAFYGKKSDAFSSFLTSLVDELMRSLPKDAFRPYPIPQMHATVSTIPLRDITHRKSRQEDISRTLAALPSLLYRSPHLPMWVRFGGYRRGIDTGFVSRDLAPYERSYVMTERSAVLLGWPFDEGGSFSSSMDGLRHDLEASGLHHEYFRERDYDNDIYMTLGRVRPGANVFRNASVIEDHIRNWMATQATVDVRLGPAEILIAYYLDDALPLSSTTTVPVEVDPVRQFISHIGL